MIELSEPVSLGVRACWSMVALAVGLACLSAWGALGDEPSGSEGAGSRIVLMGIGVVLVVAAPGNFFYARRRLDLTERQLVEATCYGAWVLRQRRTPLSSFAGVLVRHTAHESAESETTYTTDVGLKRGGGEPVLWLRSFRCGEEGVSDEARAFGRALQQLADLPGNADRV